MRAPWTSRYTEMVQPPQRTALECSIPSTSPPLMYVGFQVMYIDTSVLDWLIQVSNFSLEGDLLS